MSVRILVVAEHTLVREAIVKLLGADHETEVVGEAANGPEAIDKMRDLAPHVVLMDLSMTGMDGIEATRLLKAESPDTQVILVGGSADEETIVEAVRAGARGYITKNTDGSALLEQVKRAKAGGVALSDDMTAKLIDALSREKPANGAPNGNLSAREKEVLGLLCQGATNKEIASTLFVSENTVRAHVRSLMQKLDADNRTQLAIYAMHHGIGQPEKTGRNGTGARPGNGGESQRSHIRDLISSSLLPHAA
jgi:two-component system nitrate/nitrite response regulator NarL